MGARHSFFVGVLLLAGTLLSAIPVFTQIPYAVGDEIKCSIPTINFIFEHARPPLFIFSNAYMAPVQELVASVLFRATGGNINALRAVGVLFIAFGALVWYRFLYRIYTPRVALASVASFVLCTAPVAVTRIIMPGYSFGCLVVPVFLTFLFTIGSRHPLVLGLAGGIAYYCYPIVIPLIIVAGITIMVQAAAHRTGFRLNVPKDRWLYLLVAGLALLLPAFYFTFSGATTLSRQLKLLSLAGVLLVVIALTALAVKHHGGNTLRKVLLAAVFYVSGFTAICLAVSFVFEHYERPFFEANGVTLWAANKFQLKNIHAWPSQVTAFTGRILPFVLVPLPLSPQIRLYQDRFFYIGIVGVLVTLTVAVALWKWLVSAFSDMTLLSKKTMWFLVAPLPCFVMMGLLVPSWRLFGDPSLRYLIAFLPGLYAVLFGALEMFARREWIYWSVVAGYLSLNVIYYFTSNVNLFLQ